MGIFDKAIGKDSSLPKSLQQFLDATDTLYMRAHATRSMSALSACVHVDCIRRITPKIYANQSRYFGTPKFRTTTWTMLAPEPTDEVGGMVRVKKSVVFSKIALNKSYSVNASTDYEEVWSVHRDLPCGKYLVLDIVGRY